MPRLYAVFYLKMIGKIKTFFAEAKHELKHVNWPTRQETIRLTGVVIGISVGLALFLGLFDAIFIDLIKRLVI